MLLFLSAFQYNNAVARIYKSNFYKMGNFIHFINILTVTGMSRFNYG